MTVGEGVLVSESPPLNHLYHHRLNLRLMQMILDLYHLLAKPEEVPGLKRSITGWTPHLLLLHLGGDR